MSESQEEQQKRMLLEEELQNVQKELKRVNGMQVEQDRLLKELEEQKAENVKLKQVVDAQKTKQEKALQKFKEGIEEEKKAEMEAQEAIRKAERERLEAEAEIEKQRQARVAARSRPSSASGVPPPSSPLPPPPPAKPVKPQPPAERPEVDPGRGRWPRRLKQLETDTADLGDVEISTEQGSSSKPATADKRGLMDAWIDSRPAQDGVAHLRRAGRYDKVASEVAAGRGKFVDKPNTTAAYAADPGIVF